MKKHLPALCVLLAVTATGFAQEFSVAAGASRAEADSTYAWQISFRHRWRPNLAWSGSWINEGHAPTYHRDGFAAQAWLGREAEPGRFAGSVGLGAYYYSNTILLPARASVNAHGTAPIVSLSGTYSTRSPWFFRATANYIAPRDGRDSLGVLAGAGYRFGSTPEDVLGRFTPAPPQETGSELTAYFGRSIENTAVSENAGAAALEYRRSLGRNFQWSVLWLNQGNAAVVRRSGVGSQFWVSESFPHERLSIGLGVGPYYFSDTLTTLLTPTVAFRITQRWILRFNWERIISTDDRDADVFLLGLGLSAAPRGAARGLAHGAWGMERRLVRTRDR